MLDNLNRKLIEGPYLYRKGPLNPHIKLSIILVLIYILNTNFWVSEFLHNLGIPYLRYQKLFFLVLPGIYILAFAQKNNKMRFKNLGVFLVFYITHFAMEHYAYGSDYIPNDPIDLLNKWMYIFIGYYSLINAGIKYSKFVLTTVVSLILLNTAIVYLDYFGLINVANISSGTDGFEGRLNSKFNLNALNDMGVLGIYIIVWLSYLNTPYRLFGIKLPIISYIVFISGFVFLQASRGSIILLLVGFLLYIYEKWKFFSLLNKVSFILFVLVLSSFKISISTAFIDNFSVFNRISELSLTEDDALEKQDGRFLQVLASYENFKSNPYIGVGYEKATDGMFDGIVRSNFQYTQILASGGILLFGVYFFMIFKFFAHSIQLLRKDIIVMSIFVFVLVVFIFRRPEAYFAVIAFIVFERSQLLNTKHLLK